MESSPATGPSSRAGRWPGLLTLVAALLPSLAAIWAVPWFVTQDGPAHLYNAQILKASLGPDSPFREVYEVQWKPLPNWAGHLTLMALLGALPPRAADRAMMSLTLVAFAAAVAWLRWKVAGWRGMVPSALMAALLAMNLTWLFGFSSFLLGSSLFAATLGLWWGWRDRMGPGRALALSALLVLGYFCHPISLGLTVAALGILALTTPGPGVPARVGWTGLAGLPLVPLAFYYRGVMRTGGAFKPVWVDLKDPRSLDSWLARIGWVDPITLGSKAALPFVESKSTLYGLLTPVVWLGLGMATLAAASVLGRGRPGGGEGEPSVWNERRGWAVLAVVLLLGGLASPDTLGGNHGFYLAQRIFLLGLVCAVPLLEPTGSRLLARLGTAALAVAVAVQAAFVWDYARHSDRVVGEFLRAKPHVGRGTRLAALLVELRGPYRVNPLLHADTLLGVGTGNVVWSNYETAFYYFPVQIRPGVPHPPEGDFELVSIRDDPKDAELRASQWEDLLEAHHAEIDALVVFGRDPRLDAITERWYEPVFDEPGGRSRVFRRRPVPNPGPSRGVGNAG
jgi:hypothetical protein